MLSIPLYTVSNAPRIFVEDRPRLGTLIHIRNLSMGLYFGDFPQFMWPPIEPYTMSRWIKLCNIQHIGLYDKPSISMHLDYAKALRRIF